MKAYIISLGCPKNLTDSEVLMGKLISSGHEIITDPSQAEMIIINTCAFIKPARDEAYATIKEMSKWKKKGKCQKLYVAGCLPRWDRDVQSQVPSVISIIDSIDLFNCHTPRIKATQPWTAYVKIAEGCNNYCSYCLIPKIRGKLRSRKIDDIQNEVKTLAKRGVKEIIFIAQDTTAYPSFADLLKKTARISGLRWIRIMYAHPAHLTDEIIKVIAAEKKIVKYLDISIQHVSNKILKNMNRPYDHSYLKNLISKLRTQFPNLALRTTIMVGFPGETEADFAELIEFIKVTKFDRLGVFPYYNEKGTTANKMKGQVSQKTKKDRVRKIMQLQSHISKRLNQKFLGKTLEVLIEGKNFGRSYRDAPEIDGKVYIKSKKPLILGSLIKVKITAAKTYDLIVDFP